MWIIQTKKYAGVLSMLSGMNNVVHLSNGMIRVSIPSRVGYAELKVEELNENVEAMYDIAPLIQMFGSKSCNEVYFSPSSQKAMFKKPYIFSKAVPESSDEEELAGINESREIPKRIRESLGENAEGVYVDDDGEKYDVATILLDNVIFTDMARQLGAPRVRMTISFDKETMILTNEDGERAVYPKQRDDEFPSKPIKITLSAETQPYAYSSLMGEKSRIYIVNEKFMMIDAAGGLYTFICAACGDEGYSTDFGGQQVE